MIGETISHYRLLSKVAALNGPNISAVYDVGMQSKNEDWGQACDLRFPIVCKR
jgi:hypothetical protein